MVMMPASIGSSTLSIPGSGLVAELPAASEKGGPFAELPVLEFGGVGAALLPDVTVPLLLPADPLG